MTNPNDLPEKLLYIHAVRYDKDDQTVVAEFKVSEEPTGPPFALSRSEMIDRANNGYSFFSFPPGKNTLKHPINCVVITQSYFKKANQRFDDLSELPTFVSLHGF